MLLLRFVLLLLLMVFPTSFLLAQPDSLRSVAGVVRDSATDGLLRFATVRVEGTQRGAITNAKGEFLLRLSPGTYALSVTMVGRRPERKTITLGKDSLFVEVRLAEAPFQAREITVSPEDPGVRIMRRAIARKLRQNDSLQTYRYTLYTRFVVSTDTLTAGRFSNRGDTSVFSIFESYSTGWFRRPDEYFNQIIQRRQTANIPPEANFVAFGTNLNAFDDFITVLGEEIATPFHPDALEFYTFVLERTFRQDDSVTISRISFEPNSSSRKLFSGYLDIDADRLLPYTIAMTPNRAVQLPFDASLSYRQQFQDVGGFVMPTGMTIESSIDASLFWIISPRVDITIETVAYDFTANLPVDDDLFSQRRVESSEQADQFDSLFWNRNMVLPLRPEELAAYDQIRTALENPDSVEGTGFIDKALGEIPRTIGKLSRKPFTGLDDIIRYNTVHGAYVGIGLTAELLPWLEGTAKAGYGMSDSRGYAEGLVRAYVDSLHRFSLYGNGYRKLARRDNPLVVTTRGITALTLLNGTDYGDYYYSNGFELGAEAGFGQLKFIRRDLFVRPTSVRLFFRNEDHRTAAQRSNFSIFGGSELKRSNPPIIEGTLRSVGFEMNLNYSPLRTISDLGMQITGEFSNPDILPSGFTFQQYTAAVVLRTRTLPLWELDMRLSGGFSRGDLPPQRFFSLESAASAIAGEAVFRGMNVKEFYGDRFASISLEHNFGEVIPGVLRIPNVAAFGIEFIMLGRAGWTEFSQQILDFTGTTFPTTATTADRWYYEVGLGLNRVLFFLRFDFTARLSQVFSPKLMFTISGATR